MKLLTALALATTLVASTAQASILSIFPSFTLGPYAGIRAGYSSSNDAVLGANVGYDLGLLRFEGDYDRLGFRNASSNVLTTNGIFQLPFGKLTPYALAGVGYQFSNSSGVFADTANWRSGSALWALGGGLRYAMTGWVELDGRYRYMQPFSFAFDPANPYRAGEGYHVVTGGVNFRF